MVVINVFEKHLFIFLVLNNLTVNDPREIILQ